MVDACQQRAGHLTAIHRTIGAIPLAPCRAHGDSVIDGVIHEAIQRLVVVFASVLACLRHLSAVGFSRAGRSSLR
eukprot:6237624-Pyramimonas_sp.AAC.1